MSQFPFEPPRMVTLPVSGADERFPVHRVYCIGRNYAAHAIEMGHDPNREAPFFFQKNPGNLDTSGKFPYPAHSRDVHHEIELAVMLRSGGTGIAIGQSLEHVYGYAVAIDMTRRDLQSEQKRLRRPWEISKAFERSAPVGPVHLVSNVGHLPEGKIVLKVNGKTRQAGDLNQLIWKVPEIISYLSEYFELAGGDVILTGTPSGVASIETGDVMEAEIASLGRITVSVV